MATVYRRARIARRLLAVVALFALFAGAPLLLNAQLRVAPLDLGQGHAALGLALRHLGNIGIFMQADAHPDDENNGLLVMLNRGQGFRTALATATRGNGGQNEIGPELGEALGVLRTEELNAVHRFDGAEQYFTRAVDFGYSFSEEETEKKWGPDETIADFVRLIRTVRPDVMIVQAPDQFGDGAQHPTAGRLSAEAAKLAGDSSKYPDQLKLGLRAWQPKKVYIPIRVGSSGSLCTLNLATFDPLLGRTYAEVGTEARSMHKCQGMAQLLALPGPSMSYYQLVQNTLARQQPAAEQSLFDGIDTSIGGLAQFAGPKPPRDLTEGLSAIASAVQLAQKKFDTVGDDAVVDPLAAALRALRALRATVRGLPDPGRFEIDFRLRQKERELQQAILLANSLRVDALADDGIVVPGQPVRVSLSIANRGTGDVAVKQVKFEGFDGESGCTLDTAVLKRGQVTKCEPTFHVKRDERATEPYWHRAGEAGLYTFDEDAPFGLPYRPTPFYAQVTFGLANGEEVIDGLPIQYRYQGNIFSGEKRSDLLVVPALSVRVSPEIEIVPQAPAAPPPAPAQRPAATKQTNSAPSTNEARSTRPSPAAPVKTAAPGPAERELRVTVVNNTKGPAQTSVRLVLPPGWESMPSEEMINFSKEDESRTVRFEVKLPAGTTTTGEYHVRASASLNSQSFERGFETIEYPHIRRQHIYDDADVTMKVLDVKIAPNLTVGYVMGTGDEVPESIRQLGAKVEMLGPDDLAWGDLSHLNAIVLGIRAYERREDLRANNSRLIDYVNAGGTLIVQYNKLEFNGAQYGPYPAQVGRGRVTDETAPVTVLEPANPIFKSPNVITDQTWDGWVQERGLYFLGEHDSRYHDLISLEDPFPLNTGVKLGALVDGPYGKGHWIYVGLGLWRELPAGVPGAYQLLANLISLK